MKQKIIPTIFATNLEDFKKQYEKVKDLSDHFHIDIMDGQFVKGVSVSLSNLNFLKEEKGKTFEIHLMCNNPTSYLETCKEFNVNKVLFHYEAEFQQSITKSIREIKKENFEPVLSINPQTRSGVLLPYLNLLDTVMLMSVVPGKQGQEFIEKTYEKIKRIREVNSKILIQIDGGVKVEEIKKLSSCGANFFCVGSFLNLSENPKENFKILKSKLK